MILDVLGTVFLILGGILISSPLSNHPTKIKRSLRIRILSYALYIVGAIMSIIIGIQKDVYGVLVVSQAFFVMLDSWGIYNCCKSMRKIKNESQDN